MESKNNEILIRQFAGTMSEEQLKGLVMQNLKNIWDVAEKESEVDAWVNSAYVAFSALCLKYQSLNKTHQY